jgi:spore germination cell wall hydrolase CwlJ-like protein
MESKVKLLALILALSSFAFSPAELETCALGEARGEGVKGMTAIVQSINYRGTLSGVYGCKANLARVTKAERASAKQAVSLARTGPDIVIGADHWGNAADVKIFRRSAWFKNCKQTAKIGNHYFFKCTKPTTKKRGTK